MGLHYGIFLRCVITVNPTMQCNISHNAAGTKYIRPAPWTSEICPSQSYDKAYDNGSRWCDGQRFGEHGRELAEGPLAHGKYLATKTWIKIKIGVKGCSAIRLQSLKKAKIIRKIWELRSPGRDMEGENNRWLKKLRWTFVGSRETFVGSCRSQHAIFFYPPIYFPPPCPFWCSVEDSLAANINI